MRRIRRVRRCGLVGGSVLLRLGFEVSEAQAQAVSLSLSAVCGSGYKPLSSRAMLACVATLVATVTVSFHSNKTVTKTDWTTLKDRYDDKSSSITQPQD